MVLSLIDIAAKDGDLELVKTLYKMGHNCTERTLKLAAMNGHLDVVKWCYLDIKNNEATENKYYYILLKGPIFIKRGLIQATEANVYKDIFDNIKSHVITHFNEFCKINAIDPKMETISNYMKSIHRLTDDCEKAVNIFIDKVD